MTVLRRAGVLVGVAAFAMAGLLFQMSSAQAAEVGTAATVQEATGAGALGTSDHPSKHHRKWCDYKKRDHHKKWWDHRNRHYGKWCDYKKRYHHDRKWWDHDRKWWDHDKKRDHDDKKWRDHDRKNDRDRDHGRDRD